MNTIFLNRVTGVFLAIMFLQSVSFNQKFESFNFQAPSLDNQWISNQVYIPQGYDENSDARYPVIIYLHDWDASGWAPTASACLLKETVSELITAGEIEPIIMIFPGVITNLTNNYGSGHMWTNSEYYGNIADVITKDLFEWMRYEDKMNLSSKITLKREQTAIGGLFMGADGALRILFNHPEKFMGVVSNYPRLPIIETKYLEDNLIPGIIQSTGQSNPPYSFSAESGSFTKLMYAYSAAWAPLKNGKVQFLLNSDGVIQAEILKYWIDTADCSTLITKNNIYKEGIFSPFIFIEDIEESTASSEFIKRLERVTSPGNTHYESKPGLEGITKKTMKIGIKWIVDKMKTSTPISTLFKQQEPISVFPNPISNEINIKFTSDDQQMLVYEIINLSGQMVYQQNLNAEVGSNLHRLNIHNHLNKGIYLLKLFGYNRVYTQKLISR